MVWVGIYAYIMMAAAYNAKLLGASLACAIGVSIVYPEVDYAIGLCLWLLISSGLASFRD